MLRLQRLTREPAIESLPIPAGRRAMDRQAALVGGRQPVAAIRVLQVDGAAGPLDARLYVPGALVPADTGPSGLLVFLHGGGMIYGSLDSHDAVCRFLAERAGVRVLAVDYRLAPEHRFPAAVDDAAAAYRWAVTHAASLDADPARIGVGGDSAGGLLSATTAATAAREGLPCALQLLVYPATDMVTASHSREVFGRGLFLTTEFMDLATASYLPEEADRADPRASPQLAEPPAGLAPAYVATAALDPLRDEGEAYAAKLRAAGVEVECRRFDGQIHGFLNVLVAPSSRAATEEIAGVVARSLATPRTGSRQDR
ncbi:alpha/beta hydrolase [Nocardioides mangrovicus]|uniref:Alpha/beta hydrolase n=2 Tax=Nocardioides mangrovicus TaxID=2478913 RepID=A0A3L8NZF7_9ACTN|nr:alpha/beta hydrolase [Nocardioides mangrovicus]